LASLGKILSTLFFTVYICNTAFSQFVDFGRNKVQYNDFDWYVLNTEHFQIYYYQEARELAEQGAYFAEESYKYLQQKFKHSLTDTIPLIFYTTPSHFKETNTTPGLIPDGVGGFFEFIKGRVVIPYDGSLGNFKHVIRHELTHVFMTSKAVSTQKIHGELSERLPSLWFTEGLAEYCSTDWDMQAEMVLKDAIINGNAGGLSDWESFYGTFFMYKLGQRACMYIADKYGEQKLLEIVDNIWLYDNFENVFEYTLGIDYAGFDKDFLYSLKKYYFPILKNCDDPSQVSSNIFSDGFSHKPAFSKQGNKEEIYFIGNRMGYTSIFRINLSNKNKVELVIEGESSDLYEQFHYFRTGLDISKNGYIAFSAQKGAADALFVYDTKNKTLKENYTFKGIVGISAPSWSKDSKRIVFSGMEFSGKSDLYIFEPETNNLRRLTNDYYDDADPCFSPDGRYIVFSSDRTSFGDKNIHNLFIYDLETNKINYLTHGEHNDVSPNFSEDGKRIVYASESNNTSNIWVMEFDTILIKCRTKRITNFTTAGFDPKWCGNDRIVFSNYEKGMMTIRMIDKIFPEKDSVINRIDIVANYTENQWSQGKISGDNKQQKIKYNKRFSFDVATTDIVADPVFGTFAGGALSLSDILGNEKYYFLIYNNASYDVDFWKSFNIAISKISLEKRLNYAYGVFHLSGRRYDLRESDYSYFERIYGGYASFSYPLSTFKRIEITTNLSESEKDVDFLDNRRSLLLSNSISFVRDNSLWWYTGPIDGERFNLTLGYTTDLENSNENFYSVLLDYRKYFRISKFVSLAARGQFFMNDGKYARRYFMGGSWSLRGWSWLSMRGTKLWQTNAELRFPLLDLLALRFPLGINLEFPAIRGAIFFDAGNTWDNSDNYYETKGSIGAGLRINILRFLVLRYDIGKRIENNFTKLQGSLFQQFFFGWDF